jgi:hypothetical protein
VKVKKEQKAKEKTVPKKTVVPKEKTVPKKTVVETLETNNSQQIQNEITVPLVEEKVQTNNNQQRPKPMDIIVPKKKAVKTLENNQLFTLTTESSDVKLLKNKRNKSETKSQKKYKNNEERKIKRIGLEMNLAGNIDKNNVKKEEKLYDLWANNNKTSALIKLEPMKYPKVVIPHPGQSYNPNREDLKNLLQTIVDINKPKDIQEVVPSTLNLADGKFVAPEDQADKEDQKVSNNPPVNDTDRFPRRIRNKLHASKLNKQRNLAQETKKKQKVVINSMKVFHNFNKQVEKNKKTKDDEKKKNEDESKRQKDLINLGVYYKDTDVLDYKINKKDVSLKNLTHNKSLISDRYENILKRNIIGETSVKKKRNRKLNKIQYRENQDFFFDEANHNLKIIN